MWVLTSPGARKVHEVTLNTAHCATLFLPQCGGFAAIKCPAGMQCKTPATGADMMGTCVYMRD